MPKRWLVRVVLCALFAISTHAEEAQATAPMTLVVSTTSVTVSNVARGSTVILFGVGREPRRYRSAVRRWTEVLVDKDEDGIVRYEAAITDKSIWIAVNADDGTFTSETGPNYPRRETTTGSQVKRNNAGQLSKFENARGVAELLVVRPGKNASAWRVSAAKNSSVDEAQGTPEPMRIDASSFRTVEGVASEEFRHLKHGDILAMIDPRLMEFYVVEVGED